MPQVLNAQYEDVDTSHHSDAEENRMMRYESSIAEMINKDAARQTRAFQQFLTQESGLMGAVNKLVHSPEVGTMFWDKWGKNIEGEIQKVVDSYHAGKFDPSQTYKVKKLLQDPQMLGFMQQAMQREQMQEKIRGDWDNHSEYWKKHHNPDDVLALGPDAVDDAGNTTPQWKNPNVAGYDSEMTEKEYLDTILKTLKPQSVGGRSIVTPEEAGKRWDEAFSGVINPQQQNDLINSYIYRNAFNLPGAGAVSGQKIMDTIEELDSLDEKARGDLFTAHPEVKSLYNTFHNAMPTLRHAALNHLRQEYVDFATHNPAVDKTTNTNIAYGGAGGGMSYSSDGGVTREGDVDYDTQNPRVGTTDYDALQELLATKKNSDEGVIYQIKQNTTGRADRVMNSHTTEGVGDTFKVFHANNTSGLTVDKRGFQYKDSKGKVHTNGSWMPDRFFGDLAQLIRNNESTMTSRGVNQGGGSFKGTAMVSHQAMENFCNRMYHANQALYEAHGITGGKSLRDYLIKNRIIEDLQVSKYATKEHWAAGNPNGTQDVYLIKVDFGRGAGRGTLIDATTKNSALTKKQKQAEIKDIKNNKKR
jgi:hypothetical protein